jgi:hypothetical protein
MSANAKVVYKILVRLSNDKRVVSVMVCDVTFILAQPKFIVRFTSLEICVLRTYCVGFTMVR